MDNVIERINKSNKKDLLILAKQYDIETTSNMRVGPLRTAIKNKITQNKITQNKNNKYIYDKDEEEDIEDEEDDIPKVKAISSRRIGNNFNDISFFD